MYRQQYGWGKRSEVEVMLDSRNNTTDNCAYQLHKVHQTRQGRGCRCGGSGCESCWSPATALFDYNRAAVSYMRDLMDCLYGRYNPCGPSWYRPGCEPEPCEPCGPERMGKKTVCAIVDQKTSDSFTIFNPTCDAIKLGLSIDGFGDPKGPQVSFDPKPSTADLAPGETRTIFFSVDLMTTFEYDANKLTYCGVIRVNTPFAKLIDLEVKILNPLG
jgi:hypothetical protein